MASAIGAAIVNITAKAAGAMNKAGANMRRSRKDKILVSAGVAICGASIREAAA
jgi:uncharacterized membrane protein YadS